MKIHPFIAAAVLLLAGVMAFGATVVVRHRQARARRPPPTPDLEEPAPAPRQARPLVEAPRVRPAAPPAAPPTVELHVHVSGPHGIALDSADVSIHRRGADEDDWSPLEEAEAEGENPGQDVGRFEVSHLEPGHYDLRVEANGMRTARLDDVRPGARVIEVALARSPVLLGAIGRMGAAGCGDVTVAWSGPEEGGERGEATVDPDDCTFVAETLPDAGPITVVATRGARRESALVTPPLSGDPAFLCLAPPCSEEPASLLVYVADTDHRQVDDATLNWTLQGFELDGAMGTSMGAGVLFVHGRRAGQTLALRAERGGQEVEATTLVGPGVTEALLTLPVEAPPTEEDSDEIVGDTAEPEPAPGRSRVIVIR
jgi:hypothetical protein